MVYLKERVLITGAGGFIGKNILEEMKNTLDDNFEIHTITRNTLEIDGVISHNIDITDKIEVERSLSCIKAKYLLHLAWDVTPEVFFEDSKNIDYMSASMMLIKYFVENGGMRVVTAGTCFEYDIKQKYLNEYGSYFKPDTLYGKCKNTMSNLAKFYCTKKSVSYASAKYFYLYGEGEKNERLIPYIINELMLDKEVVCKNPNAVRDYMNIKDASKATLKLLFSNIEGDVNISTGKGMYIGEIFKIISRKLKKENLVIYLEEGDKNIIIGDNCRLRNELDFYDYTDFSLGIDLLISNVK